MTSHFTGALMPTFDFSSPGGKIDSVTGPEGSTAEQAWSVLQQHLKDLSPGINVFTTAESCCGSSSFSFPTGSSEDIIKGAIDRHFGHAAASNGSWWIQDSTTKYTTKYETATNSVIDAYNSLLTDWGFSSLAMPHFAWHWPTLAAIAIVLTISIIYRSRKALRKPFGELCVLFGFAFTTATLSAIVHPNSSDDGFFAPILAMIAGACLLGGLALLRKPKMEAIGTRELGGSK
jgi:hypothetical protein